MPTKIKLTMLSLILIALLLAACSSNDTPPIGPTDTISENLDKAVARSFDDWLADACTASLESVSVRTN